MTKLKQDSTFKASFITAGILGEVGKVLLMVWLIGVLFVALFHQQLGL
jgi:hypothetical protein